MYRCYDTDEQKWIKNFYITPDGAMFTFKKKLFGSSLEPMPTNRYILHRSIEETDRNGKKMYEGDIVVNTEDNDVKGVIAYSADHAAYYIFDKKHNSYYGIINASRDEMEVIGNVFDNPDILEDDEIIDVKPEPEEMPEEAGSDKKEAL